MWYTKVEKRRDVSSREFARQGAGRAFRRREVLILQNCGGGRGTKEARIEYLAGLTETADWAMLHNTNRTGKQDGIYLALSAFEKE
jgi:hypothetical protein